VLLGIGSPTSHAAAINFTGNVVADFPESADPTTSNIKIVNVGSKVGQSPWITDNKWTSGWSVQDLRFSWDKTNDVLYVGVNNMAGENGLAPFGQANGNPAGTPESYDPAHLGYGDPNSDKSFALMFSRTDPSNQNQPGEPVMIAGVPADKTKNGPGTDGFNISTVDKSNSESGLGYMFGNSLIGTGADSLSGNLAYDPSPAHPQLEFAIKNFSKVIDPTKGFWIDMYAGSGIDGVAGESHVSVAVGSLAEQGVPEPSTVLAWTLASAGLAWRVRSRKRAGA
jgi:hypothetical protein